MHGERYTPEDVDELEKQSWAALELLEHSEPIVNAEWRYYVNDEGKARWRCGNCGKICRRDPHDKARCSRCGAHMAKEA
jgi:rubrerythrin